LKNKIEVVTLLGHSRETFAAKAGSGNPE